MAQDDTVYFVCCECGQEDESFKMVPDTEKMYYDAESDRIIWTAVYECPCCGQTVRSTEVYTMDFDDREWM